MVVHSGKGPTANQATAGEKREEDVVKRLMQKNRKLEEELARLINKRESFYAKQVAEAKEKCETLVRAKEENHTAMEEEQQRSLAETRAAAVIMCSLFMSRKRKLQGEIKGNREDSERQLAAAQDKMAQMEAEHASTTRDLQEKLEATVHDYEAKVSRMRSDAETRIALLEQQLSTVREEKYHLEDAAVKAKAEIQDLHLQLQRRLADMERLEGLVAAPRTMIKEIQNKAQLQKETLEKEIGDYVRFIVATHRASPEPPVRPRTTPAPRYHTAVRPSSPTPVSPKAPRPMQIPASARAPVVGTTSLPPLGDDGQGSNTGSRSSTKYRPEAVRYG